MRILIINTDEFVRSDLIAALTGQNVSMRESTDRDQILRLLMGSSESVVVIINLILSDAIVITTLLQEIADTPSLSSGHAFIFLLATADTIPIRLGHIIPQLPVYFAAKPINVSAIRTAVLTAYKHVYQKQRTSSLASEHSTGQFDPI